MRTLLGQLKCALSFLVVMHLGSFPRQVAAQEHEDRLESPFLKVHSEDGEVDRIPLKSTAVHAVIAGVIADVTVTQVYRNEGKRPLEAVYVFPGSTRAAVHAMKMQIGERVIEAKIREREAARTQYESAKKEGKSTALLESQRPNVFQMNVANILPNDEIKIELSYTELLVPTEGRYEFIYPTVVGPRYVGSSNQEGSTIASWVQNPYLEEGQSSTTMFALSLEVSAGMPIQEMISPSHKVDIQYPDRSFASVKYSDSQSVDKGDRKDFVLHYRLQDKQIETGTLLYEGLDENFFLVMLQPPARPTPEQVAPREYIFVVDVSGSMHGFPLMVAKGLMVQLIKSLHPMDRFNVVLFAGDHAVLSETSLEGSEANQARALEMLNGRHGGGGTELLPALQTALKLPDQQGMARSIVVVTDGYVNVERQAFDLIRENLGKANLFSLGIGSSVNRYLIEGMARAGLGEPTIILNIFGAGDAAERFRSYIASPVLTDITVDYGSFDVYDTQPVTVPDLFAERPLILYGKWRGKRAGIITLKGRSGSTSFERKIDLSNVKSDLNLHGLGYLWAREKIASLADYNRLSYRKESEQAITQLGLKYNLLTEYTSFLAIDSEVRNAAGDPKSVFQPLPLPTGVSNFAVGGMLGTSPEPETWGLMMVLSSLLIGLAIRQYLGGARSLR